MGTVEGSRKGHCPRESDVEAPVFMFLFVNRNGTQTCRVVFGAVIL